ncbi:putative bifunctional diguanylate cyclase/phosphodiesterase [Occallatibacter riparius]|uniref:EAL domain-containing protein n=1 Tax=Occallatibacter riparius TaxID=1002689 RepID=A0A9J7BLX7_9BACT|nr:EAL domain-containing protein [Occallatibacter riparius]UWZ83489.1 EAL domain-containing protein [Occallatibacter riparius]
MAALVWDGIGLMRPEDPGWAQQRIVLDALPALVFVERGGMIVYANAEARREIGVEGAWQERPVDDVLWGLHAGTAEPRTHITGTGRSSPFHATLACKNGRMTPVEGTQCLVDVLKRESVIVAQVAGRERTRKPGLMEDVLASLPEAVVIVYGSKVLYTNPAFTRIFGFLADEVSGGELREFMVPETRLYEHSMLQKLVDETGHASVETVRYNSKGELVDVAMQVSPLQVSGGKAGYVFTFRDISERKQVEAKLQHDAMHDVLTGLPNRALFADRLKQGMNRRERRADRGCAVFFLDVDHFKQINDSLGHAAGDALLIAMADRLLRVVRPHDTAARMGGDEFAILVENILSVQDLDALAERILAELDEPFEVLGHRLQVLSSVGIALVRNEHRTPEEVITDADVAMYRAKQEGGHRYAIFDRHMEVQVSSQQERERELREVVTNREFVYWYQPIYWLADGRLKGFESLLRRKMAKGALESFRDLLPVADETGLSISLGRDAIESACSQLVEWDRRMPGNEIILTLNLSRRQFYQEEHLEQLGRTLASTRIDPSRLLFEVSEGTLNENPDKALVIVQRLVDCGVRIAMDNFGAALAPLNHLLRMPLDLVKLDPKITASVTGTGRQQAMVESLLHVCRAAGMQLVAHGIETPAHLRILQEMGCELGQGYFLAPPVDAKQAEYLASHNGRASMVRGR